MLRYNATLFARQKGQNTTNGKKQLTTRDGLSYDLLYRVTPEQARQIQQDVPTLLAKFFSLLTNKLPSIKISLGKGRSRHARLAKFGSQYLAMLKVKSTLMINSDAMHQSRANVIESTMHELELHEKLRNFVDCTHLALAEEIFIEVADIEHEPVTNNIKQIYLMMPLADMGNGVEFFRRIQSYPQAQRDLIRLYASNVFITQVAMLNARGFYHCDLKTENMLFSCDGNVWISDFGSAAYYVNGARAIEASRRTHLKYSPPILLFSTSSDEERDSVHDQWSLALALLEIWGDAAINDLVRPLFELIADHKKIHDTLSNNEEDKHALLERYITHINALSSAPAIQTIPEYLRNIVFSLLEMRSGTHRPSLSEIINPYLDALQMSTEAAAHMQSLFDPRQYSQQSVTIFRNQASSSAMHTVSSYYDFQCDEVQLSASLPDRPTSTTPSLQRDIERGSGSPSARPS